MSNLKNSHFVTHFAPSPTGYIHLGNVRSAIYPYLIAKQTNGTFILRIEDTDRSRFVDGATDLILETLTWLGLNWNEGIEVGGPHAPYYQSERRDIYHAYARKLLEKGRAYADNTSPEKINEYRKADNEKKIPYLYRNHRPEKLDSTVWEPGTPLRFKSEPKSYKWHDEVMGDLSTGPEVLDDIILIKADGMPTYNFAHIVDDLEMCVTHIVRGVEYLSSMPNYLNIYEALEIEHPKFVSLPHVLATTGNKKLSKRDGAKSVIDYKDEGVLPEAMLNYLACLGWNDGTEQEIYSKEELEKSFSINRIQSSGARFDEVKLLWQNGQWIRKIFDEQGVDALYAKTISKDEAAKAAHEANPNRDNLINFWPDSAKNYSEEYRKRVLSIIYDRLKTLSDLRSYTGYFFEDPRIDLEMLASNKFIKKLSETEQRDLLSLVIDQLNSISEPNWTAETLQDTLNHLLEQSGKKPAELFSLIRIALSFAQFSPALHLTMEVLGKNTTLSRLNATRSAIVNDL
ncbi:glutamate--tRNA ligase [Candidatus Saccharibacteria bacterium]|nr:glutamate--tRNA ligase [Candidatus Saccharibacteria bacterium]